MNQGLALYSAQQSRNLDARAIDDFAIPGYELMQRAAMAAWQAIQQHYPGLRSIGFLVGPGNNGGDALEVARLAAAAGKRTCLHLLSDPQAFQGEAAQAWQAVVDDGLVVERGEPAWRDSELWVDGLFGSGLARELDGRSLHWVEALNASGLPVFALDVPSGVHADTGAVLGAAVKADFSFSFIARKKGLYTGAALDYVGLRLFSGLDLPAQLYQLEQPCSWALPAEPAWAALPMRAVNAHKGSAGHVLLVGGVPGYSGAIRLAAQAALRAGAGLVSVYTHDDSHQIVAAACPEVMVHSSSHGESLDCLMQRASVLVIGPGLGKQAWGQAEFDAAMDCPGPCVIDADGLNLLARSPRRLPQNWVLTPHPGEAARLLNIDLAEVQADRWGAAEALTQRYGAACVLKGAGSIIAAAGRDPVVCTRGNPGMAVAGMGDVLSGVAGALIAQMPGAGAFAAMKVAVAAHAQAGDLVAQRQGQRGLLPSDVIAVLPEILNP